MRYFFNHRHLFNYLILCLLFLMCSYGNAIAQSTIIVDHAGSGDYTTIQAAVDAINGTNISQQVSIKIKAGTYDEHIKFDSITGTSKQLPIILESFSGDSADVLIDHDTASLFNQRGVLDVRKVNFIIIRNLSFNAPVDNGHIISFGEGAMNAIVEGNNFRDDNANQKYSAIGFNYNFTISNRNLDSFWINNNRATDLELFSTLSSFRAKYLEITNNIVFFNRNYTALPYHAANTIIFKNNFFENIALGSFADSRVMWIEGNINVSPTGCLVINNSSSSDSAAVVINNFLAHKSSLGIQVASQKVKIYHNNIYGYDSTRQNFGIYLNEGDSAEIINNNIVGLGDQAVGMFLTDSVYPATFICDYNNWYLPKGTMSWSNALAQVYVETLAEHIDIFKIDSNSISVNPLFYSESDLHIRNAVLIGKGLHLDLVLTDIDGDLRDPDKPTIGADVVSGSIDLVPQSFISVTGNFYPGKTVQIEYEVKNEGALDLSTVTWKDQLYLSSDQTLDQQDYLLANVTNTFSLDGGASYSRKPSVSIPYVSGGTYYLILKVNSTEVNFEEFNNNILVSQSMSLPNAQLPDLKVTSVSAPTSVLSGKSFTISWTVKNTGSAATTGSWTDYIYASHDSDLLQTPGTRNIDSILKRKVSAPQGLQVGESYTQSRTFSTPIKYSGNVYYRVQTNAQNDIFEQDTTFQDNGTLSAPINVTQSPLPDLTVADANIQSTAFSGDTISVNWSVKNIGEQKTYRADRFYNASPLQDNPKMWYDKLIITKNPFYDPRSKDNIQKAFYARPANLELEPDSSYTINDQIVLDRCEYGTYYVFAITNYTESTFELGYANNVLFVDSIEVILKPNPDLIPTELSLDNSPASGKELILSYEVTNDGFNSKTTLYQKDRFYLHKNNSFSGSVVYLGQNYGPDTLDTQESYSQTLAFQVPYDVFGQYYLSVLTDPNDIVCEAPNEDNNVKTIGPINIALSPTPDIVVSSDFDYDTLSAGQNFTIGVTNNNNGDGAVTESAWNNEIYLTGSGYKKLTIQSQSNGLAANSSRTEQLNLSIPSDLYEGLYQIVIRADYRDQVFEHDDENNNLWTSEWFYIKQNYDQTPDLEATSLRVTENNITAGDEITIEVDISNKSKATQLTGWKDEVYVIYDGEILGQMQYNHLGRLERNQSVAKELSYRLPFNVSGDIELVFLSNKNNKPFEYVRSNNELSISISVNAYIPPDLEPTAITSQNCCLVYSLQFDTLEIEVTNNGPGAVQGRSYFARVYLSEDQFLDKHDYLLATKQHFSGLNSGSSEYLEVPVKYPSHLSGDHYYIMVIDAENQIYEGAMEDNNISASGYSIQLSNEQTDLSLDSIYISNYNGSSDRFIDVNYKFSKPIADSLERNWTKLVVLSPNKDYINNGFSITSEVYANPLPAGTADFSGSLLAVVPKNTAPGWYYVGLLIDSYNEIYESSESNNLIFTADSFYFDFSVPLELNVLKDTFWIEGFFATDVYYNIDRPKDTGMVIDLIVSEKNASTEMYHRAGKIPTLEKYDNRYSNPYLADQQIIVPTTDTAVRDYVHVIPSYVPPVYSAIDPDNNIKDKVPYSIEATAKGFSIFSVYPENGSMYGNTTVEVKGFDFDSSTIFYLTKDTDTLYPESAAIINSSYAVLYLDLREKPIGNWNIIAEKPLKATELSDGFEIVGDGFEDPWVSIDVTNVELTRKSTTLNLNFGNNANTDGFDYWLVMAVSTTSGDLSNLSSFFAGSSEEVLNQEYGFDGNPTGDSTFIDEDGVRYFVYWLPKLAAKSQTTFTYIINQSEEDTTAYYALLYRQPMSNYTLSGRAEDLWQSATMYELYEAFSNNSGLLNKADFDCDNINIAGVQRELSTQTILLADHVSGGVSTFSGARNMKDMSSKAYDAWKKDALLPFQGDKRSEEVKQKIFKEMVLEKKGITDVAKGWVDNLNPFTNVTGRFYKEDPPFSDLVKNVFSCLDQDPNFQKDKSGTCLVCSWNTTRTEQRCYKNCNRKDKNEEGRFTRWVKSLDPNEIIGPEGTTDLRFVKQESEMPYTIRFENKAEASAPAVMVSINNPLDTAFRLQSFKLTEIGFGDTIIILKGQNFMNKVIDLGPNYNNQKLRIVAGIDPVNEQAIWRLTTIDPNTGNPVQDPFGGFLPPNDSTGQGEGYVKYTIKLKSDLPLGLEVNNEADIIFDNNEIIPTNIWTNIVVGSNAFSEVNELPAFSEQDFEVSWYGNDGELGVGIGSYSVYVSKDDSTYQPWIRYSTDTSAIFHGEIGSKYMFFSVIHLLDGTTELAPEQGDAETTIRTMSVQTTEPPTSVIIYPNPGSEKLNIAQESNQPLHIEIFSLDGKRVGVYNLQGRHSEIATGQFAKGLYIIEISSGNKTTYHRWIKH